MRKVIVLAGVSGVGKTHARLTDPTLRDLPCVDIADVYREYPLTDATQPASSEASGTYQCWQSTRGSLGFMLRPAQTDG